MKKKKPKKNKTVHKIKKYFSFEFIWEIFQL